MPLSTQERVYQSRLNPDYMERVPAGTVSSRYAISQILHIGLVICHVLLRNLRQRVRIREGLVTSTRVEPLAPDRARYLATRSLTLLPVVLSPRWYCLDLRVKPLVPVTLPDTVPCCCLIKDGLRCKPLSGVLHQTQPKPARRSNRHCHRSCRR